MSREHIKQIIKSTVLDDVISEVDSTEFYDDLDLEISNGHCFTWFLYYL